MKTQESQKCSYCGQKCRTVDLKLFDGLCAKCTTKSLGMESRISETAKKNQKQNYDPIPTGNWVL